MQWGCIYACFTQEKFQHLAWQMGLWKLDYLSGSMSSRICQLLPGEWYLDMGVSKNRGTPKSWILIGCSIINHPFWGTPIFGNTHMETLKMKPIETLSSEEKSADELIAGCTHQMATAKKETSRKNPPTATPHKINIKLQNTPLEKEKHLPSINSFGFQILVFWGDCRYQFWHLHL